MILKGTFLRTKVGRRILGQFMLCAIIPVTALSVVSYRHVAGQLDNGSRERLRQVGKITGLAVYERLLLLRSEMEDVSADLRDAQPAAQSTSRVARRLLRMNFAAMAIEEKEGTVALFGAEPDVPALTLPQREHLASGKPILMSMPADSQAAVRASVYMALALDSSDLTQGVLWATLDPMFLFGLGIENAGLALGEQLCVLDRAGGHHVHCPIPVTASAQMMDSTLTSSEAARFEWSDGDEEYLAGYWSLFLAYDFLASQWIFVVSESRSSVLAPVTELTLSFGLTTLVALLTVLLLSNIQIRKTLSPLEQLHEGTKRVAEKKFDVPVDIESRDEFADLAISFNAMATRLGKQFQALIAINEIDRAVLASLDTDQIIDTILSHSRKLFECDAVSVALSSGKNARRQMVAVATNERGRLTQKVQLTPEESRQLLANPDHMWLKTGQTLPGYLQFGYFAECGIGFFLVLPIFLKEDLSGLIVLGYREEPTWSDDDLMSARQLTDQVAVALANTRLVADMAELNWGTIRALARTIDAKSPWTAGHSERVTELALSIGGELDLSRDDMEILHRGGLLHDIGKIGIPASLLDKDSSLTDEEMEKMATHPQLGARILAPIAAFADAVPIVRHHHERFDGKGYPDGLVGEGIPYLARVLTVADTFDALCSDRPYRAGRSREEALDIIEKGSGTQFDPGVAEAFLLLMRDEDAGAEIRQIPQSEPERRDRYAS